MELQDGGVGGRKQLVRRPRIAGGKGPLPAHLRPPPIAATRTDPTPPVGAPLFADAEIVAHLEASLDLSLFEPELLDPTPATLSPEAVAHGLLPELPSPPPPRSEGIRLSPLSARRPPAAQEDARANRMLVLAAAMLGGVLGFQLSILFNALL